MATVRFTKIGYAEMYPTKMNMFFVFKGVGKESSSDSLLKLSEVVSSFVKIAEEECCAVFSKNLEINKGSIKTTAVYNTVEIGKDGRITKGRELSHYESTQAVLLTTDINIDIMISLLGRVVDNENLVSYNYSFGITEEERVSLKNESVKDAYDKGISFCNYLKSLLDWSYGYKIDDMSFDDANVYGSIDRVGASKSSNFEDAFMNKDVTNLKESINVENVEVSSKIKFTADFR